LKNVPATGPGAIHSKNIIHGKAEKAAPFYFCNNFVKSFVIRKIIGTHIQ